MTKYYYWVAVSKTDNTSVGDTGYIEADSAQEAAEEYAEQLGDRCSGQVVRTRSDDMGETGEAVA